MTGSRPSDALLEMLNRFYDAKISGALKKDEFSSMIKLVGGMFSNQVANGLKTTEDVANFENNLPPIDGYFSYPYNKLREAIAAIREANTVALYEAEKYNIPVGVKRM